MEVVSKQKQQKFNKKKDSRVSSIYSRCLITRSIVLPKRKSKDGIMIVVFN